MTDKLTRLWATKTRNDEWWSSFVTSPLAILFNYGAVDIPWITPNRLTLVSFLLAVAAVVGILVGGFWAFFAAAILIHLSHVLDCMDGQMARYRQVSSPLGSYYDRLTDQLQVALWFGAVGYAAALQSQAILPVLLALIGIAFYGLRGYAKYVALEIETASNPDFPAQLARQRNVEPSAGPGFGLIANLTWFLREQRKVVSFDEGVFVFMLSAALVFDQLLPMLWIFAASQIFWGIYQPWRRGRNIGESRKLSIQK